MCTVPCLTRYAPPSADYCLNARLRAPPVPFWFPATVGIGATSIAGARVGIPEGLQVAALVLSATQCLVLWPWITWRLAHSRHAAPAPSVFVHAAPAQQHNTTCNTQCYTASFVLSLCYVSMCYRGCNSVCYTCGFLEVKNL